jgi:hypothetical protein
MPRDAAPSSRAHTTYFGGLYQKLVITR